MLTFAWLFGIIPVVALYFGIVKDKITQNMNKFKQPLLGLLVIFMLFNIYNIDPTYINKDFSSNGGIAGLKEYAIAENFIFPNSYQIKTIIKVYIMVT